MPLCSLYLGHRTDHLPDVNRLPLPTNRSVLLGAYTAIRRPLGVVVVAAARVWFGWTGWLKYVQPQCAPAAKVQQSVVHP